MGEKLQGRVALITGASQGLGRGIAEAFAAEGCHLVLTARGKGPLLETREQLTATGAEVVSQAADVANADALAAVFELAEQRFGRLDLLVNNAGAFDGGPLETLSLASWDRVIATNLRGSFLGTQLAFRVMRRQGGGRIINVGSIAGQRVRPESAPYAASKHAVWGLTQVTALEGREHGITCCCLAPGNIRVDRRIDSTLAMDDEPMIEVADVAEVVLLMATLPPEAQLLHAVMIPHEQLFVGRG